jgi:hypothetical protein
MRTNPHFIQIGFDFGTSFCKCVCRDVFKGTSTWVHIPSRSTNVELPFLVPSTILYKGGKFSPLSDSEKFYTKDALPLLKMAMEKVALDKLDDPCLKPFGVAAGSFSKDALRDFVEAAAVYLLASVLGGVLSSIKQKENFKDFGSLPYDYVAVNMAIPVANAQNKKVAEMFLKSLRISWVLAEQIADSPKIELEELKTLIRSATASANSEKVHKVCSVYPEVSANLQVFAHSRSASPGYYLFTDTGAGTVDQCLFEFIRNDDRKHGVLYFPMRSWSEIDRLVVKYANSGQPYLQYLAATVSPLGSSHIERRAAQLYENDSKEPLPGDYERWRLIKESGEKHPRLLDAKDGIMRELEIETNACRQAAARKFLNIRSAKSVRLVFGGGGHCTNPYERAVKSSFENETNEKLLQAFGGSPEVVGVPPPPDLKLERSKSSWLRRLTVAYGLSYPEASLTNFTYPNDLPDVDGFFRKGNRRQ